VDQMIPVALYQGILHAKTAPGVGADLIVRSAMTDFIFLYSPVGYPVFRSGTAFHTAPFAGSIIAAPIKPPAPWRQA